MKTTNKIKAFIFFCLFIAGVGINGAAQATWMFSQGNVAVIENPAFCTYKYFGWGLQMEQNSGFSNWVHLTAPTQYGGTVGARFIRLKFYTGSVDAWVSDIHVYNGNVKVKEFSKLSYSNGWKDLQFDLGSKILFSRVISFSLKINAGVESMSHRFIFSSAGANFVP